MRAGLAHEFDGVINGFVNETLLFQLIVGPPTITEDPCPGLDVALDQRDQGGGRTIRNAHQKAPFWIVSFNPTEDPGTIDLSASIIFTLAEFRLVNFDDGAWASDGLGLALQNGYADLPCEVQPVDDGMS